MTVCLPWDDGIRWRTVRSVAPTDLPWDLDVLGDQLLRTVNGDAEYDALTSYLRTATMAAEHDTQRAIMPQTWQMILSGFPAWRIVVERPPLIEVVSLQYYDGDNATQELAVSPAEFDVLPSGEYTKAEIRPLDGETFPSTYSRPDAVTLTYRCGFEDEDDPILSEIKTGIALMVAELYKQRSLSVHEVRNAPSTLQLTRFWRRVY